VTVRQEDHTLGNVVRHQLLLDPRVRFAGYKKPHPLEEEVEIKVQTSGEVAAPQAVIDACEQLIIKLNKLKVSVAQQVALMRGSVIGGGEHQQMMF
jgi:DNA-directed RNA polymerase II subunit RPB11